MSTYITKLSRDSRKGIEKGLRSVQDKLFNISGPLMQILVLVNDLLSQSTPLDLALIRDSTQYCT